MGERRRAVLGAVVLLLSIGAEGCRSKGPSCPPREPGASPPREAEPPLGATAEDVDPCVDFYAYACTPWVKRTELPGDRSMVSPTQQATLAVEQRLRRLLEDGDGEAGAAQEARRAYARCMETEPGAVGDVELPSVIVEAIDGVDGVETFVHAVGVLLGFGVPSVFEARLLPDLEDVRRQALYLDEAGIGLAEARWLDPGDPQGGRVRSVYRARIERALQLRGVEPGRAVELATGVLALEVRLAAARPSRTESYERWRSDRPVEVDAGDAWRARLAGTLGRALSIEGVGVYYGSVRYLTALEEIIETTEPTVLRAYLRWHLVRALARWQPEDPWPRDVEEILDGRSDPPPRWRRCVLKVHDHFESLDGVLGERISPPARRQQAMAVAVRMRESLRSRIAVARGVSPQLRRHASDKVAQIDLRVGPGLGGGDSVQLEGGDGTTEQAGGWLGDALRLGGQQFARMRGGIGTSREHARWALSVISTAAYYNWADNRVSVGLPLLRAPLFDPTQHETRNLGTLGFAVAHEMGHAIGRMHIASGPDGPFSAEWALPPTWARSECVGVVYERLGAPLPPRDHARYDEAVADRIGLAVVESAYVGERGSAACWDEGDVGLRLMYTSFAQSLCVKARAERESGDLVDDVHAPHAVRVNATVAGRPLFARAFGCGGDTPLGGGPVCEVW